MPISLGVASHASCVALSCGLFRLKSTHLTSCEIEAPKSGTYKRPVLAVAVLSLVAAGYAYSRYETGPLSVRGFTDADVALVEQSIRTEYARRSGLKVADVKMSRETPNSLTGSVKVDVPSLGLVEKNCSASLGDHGQPIWQCN